MKRAAREELYVAQSEVPSSGPAFIFDADGDIGEALIQSLLDQAKALSREPASMVFVVDGSYACKLVFTDPAPMPLVRAMIKRLGGGTLRPARLEHLKLRPLMRMNESGFALFTRPVYAEAEA